MLVSLHKKPSKLPREIFVTNKNLRRQNRKISWSLFNMIPHWYFESPVALVWPGLPLAPDAPDPLYFSFNHSVMSISQDNKGTIPVSCAAHDVAPHWSLIPPKEQSAIVKLLSNFLHLTKHTHETEEEWELGPVPTLFYVQNGGPVNKSASLNARPRLVIVFATKAFCFTIQLS